MRGLPEGSVPEGSSLFARCALLLVGHVTLGTLYPLSHGSLPSAGRVVVLPECTVFPSGRCPESTSGRQAGAWGLTLVSLGDGIVTDVAVSVCHRCMCTCDLCVHWWCPRAQECLVTGWRVP